jgi:hypothetical protein
MTVINPKISLIVSTFLFGYCPEGTSQSNILNHNQKENSMEVIETQIPSKDSNDIYFLQFDNDLSNLKSGENFNLSFSPKYKYDTQKIVELETIHEQKIHLIIVSEDLEYFNHLHPTKLINGNYSLQMSLPFGGKYKLYLEYKPEGSTKITDGFNIEAKGTEKPKTIFSSEKLFFNYNDISVSLQDPSEIYSESELQLSILIMKDGRKISSDRLGNYLGEKAHAVLIGLSDFNFLHVHPMVINNQLNLHMNIVKSGYYRLWLQFQIDGLLYTADFVLEAKPSGHLMEQSNHNQHKH